MRIKLGLPVDDTLLSLLLYEGLFYAASSVPFGVRIQPGWIELPNSAFEDALNRMGDARIEAIPIVFPGNDSPNKFLEALGISAKPEKKTYRALMKVLKSNSASVKPSGDIDLTPVVEKDKLKVDLPPAGKGRGKEVAQGGKVDLAAPSLLKIDRYTGLTSTDEPLTTKQVGLRVSQYVWLLGILGVYSSFAAGARYAGDKTYYYFVFFSPSQVAELLAICDPVLLVNAMNVKWEFTTELSAVLKATYLSEATILEALLNLRMPQLLREKGLDKLDLLVVKVSPEGQTYKVYEHVPLTLTSSPPLSGVLESRGVDPNECLSCLSEALVTRWNGEVRASWLVQATAMDWPEKNHAVSALLALYRFVALGSMTGLRDFAHYLRLAADTAALRGEKSRYYRPAPEERSRYYRRLLSRLGSSCATRV